MADAKSAILKLSSKNWVDYFVFFRFPITLYPQPIYTYSLANRLGWPWKESKMHPFSGEFKYFGFTWNLEKNPFRFLNRRNFVTWRN